MESRYVATLLLHGLADTIGFKNGDWEFNYNKKTLSYEITLELLYEFIALGGINQINLADWVVSDDTIIHMYMAKTFIKHGKEYSNDFILGVKDALQNAYTSMEKDFKKGIDRAPGLTTKKSIDGFNKGVDGSILPYDRDAGGNGAAMRTSCIGLVFHGEKSRAELCKVSIETSRLTHNCAIGYLGGLNAALFTAFAIENIPIPEWVDKLLEILESSDVLSNVYDDPEEMEDYNKYINYWRLYRDSRFDASGKVIRTRLQSNLIYRTKFHFENFTKGTHPTANIGQSGANACIMAYDALLDAENCWEKLIIYSAIHLGDSDTVGAIAGSWFGAVYGLENIPPSNLKHLEFLDELTQIAKDLYRKFYK